MGPHHWDVWLDCPLLVRRGGRSVTLLREYSELPCAAERLSQDVTLKVLFIGVMSCLYVLWDVIGTLSPFTLHLPIHGMFYRRHYRTKNKYL